MPSARSALRAVLTISDLTMRSNWGGSPCPASTTPSPPSPPRINILPDGVLNPVAQQLFPMFYGYGGGGGDGGVVVGGGEGVVDAGQGLPPPLLRMVKCEMVKTALKALLADGSQAPPQRSASGSGSCPIGKSIMPSVKVT